MYLITKPDAEFLQARGVVLKNANFMVRNIIAEAKKEREKRKEQTKVQPNLLTNRFLFVLACLTIIIVCLTQLIRSIVV